MSKGLQPLLAYLDSLDARADLQVVGQHLTSLAISREDLEEYCLFSDTHYQRNKVKSSPWYDLLVLCWQPGQHSAIHDHGSSSCGFRIISGNATEVVYRKVGGTDSDLNLVEPVGVRTYPEDTICLAHDDDIHRISNESATDQLITLHLYSPALLMKVYDSTVGEYPSDLPYIAPPPFEFAVETQPR